MLAAVEAAPFTRLAAVYDAIMADVGYEAWVDFVLREATRRGFAGGRLLDLGCGTGNATTPALDRGFVADGVDASPAMVAVARRKRPDACFFVADVRALDLPHRYALAYSVFDALNNLLSDADFLATLTSVRAHLEPGGWLAFDANTRAGLRELWEDDRAEGWAGDVYYRWLHSYDASTDLATVEAYCEGPEGAFTEVHHERPYDPADLRRLLERAGYDRIEVLRFPGGDPADASDERVWAFARSPGPATDRGDR
jgi:SAM-dependent methyltransferase